MPPLAEMLRRFGRRGIIATALSGSLLFGSIGTAQAHNVVSFEEKTQAITSQYGLLPEVQSKLDQLKTLADKEGIRFRVTQGYRSQAEQEKLYAQGRTAPGKIVTKTRASKHTGRTAFDVAIEKGKTVSWDPKDYMRLGQLGQGIGLEWGGGWKTFKDYPHFQMPLDPATVARAKQLRNLTDSIAALSEQDPLYRKNVSNMLYETAVHESGRLKWNIEKNKVARSIFQIEPETARNLINWAKNKPKAMNLLTTTSGKTAKELAAMSQAQLADFLMQHDHFAAAMARVKYMSVPGRIPGTVEGRAAYWSKYYQGTNNPVKQKQYIEDLRLMNEEVKAAALSRVVQKNVKTPPQPTQGLVNKVLHEGKINHAIKSTTKKNASFFKNIGVAAEKMVNVISRRR